VPTVAGIDCSTQSTKVVVCDADSGAVLASGTASHPDATEVDPAIWWAALKQAAAGPDGGLLHGVDAVAVGGQQHGMVLLDGEGHIVRPALLWNDTRSAPDAADLVAEMGGGAAGRRRRAACRWQLHRHQAAVDRAQRAGLGGPGRGGAAAPRLAHLAALGGGGGSAARLGGHDDGPRGRLGHGLLVPRAGSTAPTCSSRRSDASCGCRGPAPAGQAGRTPGRRDRRAPGTGDNMATALGLGLETGDLVISLGTSGYGVRRHRLAGCGRVRCRRRVRRRDRALPAAGLHAQRGARARRHARLLGTDHEGLSRLALEAPAGADGLTFLPYLDGERTPDLPHARGSLHGMRRDNLTPATWPGGRRGMLCGLADGVDALRAQGLTPAGRCWWAARRGPPPSGRWPPRCSGCAGDRAAPAEYVASAPPARPPGRCPARRPRRVDRRTVPHHRAGHRRRGGGRGRVLRRAGGVYG
jgi:xylulokinase